MADTSHFKGFSIVDNHINTNLSMKRFSKQYRKAQYKLDGDIMASMIPFMPKVSGTFINATKIASAAIQGTGRVYAYYGPQGRYLYEGKVMVSAVTGSAWARFGERKVLVSQYSGKTKANEDLKYNKMANPKAQAKWFLAAKKSDGKKWTRQAKRMAGGRKSGRSNKTNRKRRNRV